MGKQQDTRSHNEKSDLESLRKKYDTSLYAFLKSNDDLIKKLGRHKR